MRRAGDNLAAATGNFPGSRVLHMPLFISRLALMVKGCAAVSKDFARSHPVLIATLAAAVTGHVVYAAWGQGAPLALGIAVAAGYALTLLGAVPAFIQERRKAKGKP